jgi:hypothetical protein
MRAAVAVLFAVVLLAACQTTPRPGRPTAAPSWRVAYTGYGHVRQSSDSGVTLQPATASSPGSTHAALVLSRRSWSDVEISARLRTDRQLRRPGPNPWEVAWLLWHYRGGKHFYYVALKPNGWEIGKEDASYPGDQRFLATGSKPRFPVGRWYRLNITQRGTAISVSVDGHLLASLTDQSQPYLAGRVGLYTEDASATFQQVFLRQPH